MIFISALLLFMLTLCPAANAQTQDAEPIQLKLSGFTTWYAAGSYNKHTPNGKDYNRFDVMGDAEVYFEGTAKISDDLKIGVMAQLEGGTDDYSDNWDEVYMFAQGNFGQLQIGDVRNVSYSMTVTAPSVSVLGAEWTYYTRQVDQPANVVFIDSTDSKDLDSLAPKLSYISPTVDGVTFGLSFTTANNSNGHDASVLYPKNDPAGEYQLKYGGVALMRYEAEVAQDMTVAASAYYGHYRPNDTTASHSEHDYGLGLKVTQGAVSVGASYRRIMADAQSVFASRQGYALDVGMSYDAGKYAVSANYFRSQARGDLANEADDRVDMYVLAAKYRLGAGIDLFADVGYLNFKDETRDSAKGNEGVGTAVGFALAF